MNTPRSAWLVLTVFVGAVLLGAWAVAEDNSSEVIEEVEVVDDVEIIEDIFEVEAAGVGMKIPVVWPIHAVLTGYSAMLLIISVLIARNKTRDRFWLPKHKTIGLVVFSTLLIGFGVAFYMVSLGPRGHFNIGHSYVGVVAIVLAGAVPTLGWIMLKAQNAKRLRKIHVWAGRIVIALMILASVLGLYHVGLL